MATVNTTWTSPASATLDKATGATIDEAMTDALASNLYHLGGTAGYIGCRAGVSGAQSVANITTTVIAYNLEQFDSDPNGAMHDTSTNNSRIVCRTAGVYRLSVWAQFANNATGFRQVSIRLNGSLVLTQESLPTLSGGVTDLTAATDYLLAVNDYVEATVHQNSGGALDVTLSALTMVKA